MIGEQIAANEAAQARWPRSQVRRAIAFLALDRTVLASFVSSRILVLAAAVVAETLVPRNPALTSGASGPLLRSLTSWDGLYYLGIARDGYHTAAVAGAYHDIAFPPLYPVLVRALALPWPAYQGLVAVVLSNMAFLVGLGLLVRLGEPYLGIGRARAAAGFLALYPFAAVFSMSYTESVFLVLSVGAFLAAEHRRAATTGLLLMLATLCRLQGAALALPLAILLWQRSERRLTPSLAWILLGPAAAAGFLGFVAWLSGSGSAYLDAQAAWGRSGLGGAPAGGSLLALLGPYNLSLVAVFLAASFALVYLRVDRMPLAYALVPILYIALSLSSGLLEAIGRITMLAFPYVWILARRSNGFRAAWLPVSAGLMTLVSVLMFGGYFVP